MSLREHRAAAAFAPGHITGFFQIHDKDEEVAKRGSRGAGVCLDLGAVTLVEVEPSDTQRIEIFIDKEPTDAPVTRAAVDYLLQAAMRDAKVDVNPWAPRGERAKVHVRVHTQLQLPVSQGFGMSAAGALSASLALARALRLGRSDAAFAAHAADIQEKGGLGDVAAQLHGGFEIRKQPGLPPWGSIQSFLGYGDVVLCVIGGGVPTKGVLGDRARRKAINEYGGRCVDALLQEPTQEHFMALSREFAEETGLMTPEVKEACDSIGRAGLGTMSMLGNSVFAIGKGDRLEELLADHGEVFRCNVSDQAAHLLEVQTQPRSPPQP